MANKKSVLQDPLLLSQLTWHDIEDLVVMELFSVTRRDPLSVGGYLNIDALDSGLFRSYFRFEKADIRRLRSALLVPDVISTPQRVLVPGDEALCITLRRLSYPNRLCELEPFFGRHYSVISSVTSYVLSHIEDKFVRLLKDVNNHTWVDLPTIDMFAQAIHSKGAPLHNCLGFIDGTARAICRPSTSQKVFFSGHKRVHSVKYQSIMCPNGIICQLSGPFFGSRHDAGILRKSKTYEKLEKLVQGHDYCLYGDPAYPLRPLLLKPYGGVRITARQEAFNREMSKVRQAVEWGFGKIAGLFAFLDFRKNQKLHRQNLPRMYRVSAILANCHTCMYGSQVSQYFGLDPPSLETYLCPRYQ
ncbi:uncharacterized protein [Dermacentor albipictus]|uniref:uncharacterized protein n=1 Tax=Dermacentor albipictus TaxID=60249 RepID=UPI0038FD3E76